MAHRQLGKLRCIAQHQQQLPHVQSSTHLCSTTIFASVLVVAAVVASTTRQGGQGKLKIEIVNIKQAFSHHPHGLVVQVVKTRNLAQVGGRKSLIIGELGGDTHRRGVHFAVFDLDATGCM